MSEWVSVLNEMSEPRWAWKLMVVYFVYIDIVIFAVATYSEHYRSVEAFWVIHYKSGMQCYPPSNIRPVVHAKSESENEYEQKIAAIYSFINIHNMHIDECLEYSFYLIGMTWTNKKIRTEFRMKSKRNIKSIRTHHQKQHSD